MAKSGKMIETTETEFYVNCSIETMNKLLDIIFLNKNCTNDESVLALSKFLCIELTEENETVEENKMVKDFPINSIIVKVYIEYFDSYYKEGRIDHALMISFPGSASLEKSSVFKLKNYLLKRKYNYANIDKNSIKIIIYFYQNEHYSNEIYDNDLVVNDDMIVDCRTWLIIDPNNYIRDELCFNLNDLKHIKYTDNIKCFDKIKF